jgi:GT2 family glycosyltransferase/glycosyltransferase involved in cell wall biosynthesis
MGGTEIYTHDLGRALHDHHGDQVTVLTREADPSRPEYGLRTETVGGLDVHVVNNTFGGCRSFAETYRNPAIRAVAARVIDEVRPEVAHIQHLTCLSTEIVAELALRRIPTLFTLNDYWLICHRGQLLDTSLQRCDGPAAGCERCIRGEAGGGRAAYQAARAVRAAQRVLPSDAGQAVHRVASRTAQHLGDRATALAEGQLRARHMRWVANRVNLVLAPSRTLEGHMLRFGLRRARLMHLPQGIDTSRLQGVERTAGASVRFGFIGSMIVSKAPHLLLEAFSGLPDGAASLEIYGGFGGYHGDDSYRSRVEPLLERPGIHHHGPVPHGEIPAAFAGIDVLVVPSIWLENAPFVIREAFTAGVPVVTSDLGGMAEMVRHEVNGLRFAAGDADDLRRTLARLVDEPSLVDRLRQGIPPVMTIEEDAAQLRDLYRAQLDDPAGPRLTAVVLNYRTADDTILAVRSLQSSERAPHHLVVIDNGSDDGSGDTLAGHLDGVEHLHLGSNLGFSGGCNEGLRAAVGHDADLIFLLNGDALVAGDTLTRLERALLADPDAGIAGPVVLHRSDPGRIAGAGMSFSSSTGRMRHHRAGAPWNEEPAGRITRVAGVDGCAMLIDRQVLDDVGLLHEDYFFTFEDLDLCLRARRVGYATVVAGDAVCYHAGSLSIGPRSAQRLYYATRNHLLLARRAAPLPWPLSLARAKVIVALNLAHALRSGWAPPGPSLAACLRGARDHLRGRYGRAAT